MTRTADTVHQHSSPPRQQTYARLLLLVFVIASISLTHYLAPLQLHYLHDIFQRLYYLPIILSAFWFGLWGGVGCALLVSLLYAPHIVFQWGGSLTLELEKYLEILMYNVVGGLTGLLTQRDRRQRKELQLTAEGLEQSYRALQEQTERIGAVEEQLRRSERLSTLGEMAAVLAHEVRNPLASLRGTAEILRDDFRPGTPKHEFVEIQIKETERLNRVVEEFLRMARQQPGELQRCVVAEELETIVTLTSNEARRRKVTLQLEAANRDLVVNADGEKLRQAFLNIILNALQATPEGGRVTIAVQPQQQSCEIRISDSGPGINDEIRQRIFEPFFTTKPDGTGLGLAVTKKIIEAHGGSLSVESAAGSGTTMVVQLPLSH
ncbi:sensor histidine kinase [Trichlorobacter lovleyi]|uniref:ATP-binding protein n=1 Tax=Trichlorobacter lovleyi TaxID=313985 RepID=UPI002240D02E|nr:ATP-binding protein [Trichlorobacter lovleyi]QOX80055.1 sensor histidine kinase [Trichlorobacter lovleyi]